MDTFFISRNGAKTQGITLAQPVIVSIVYSKLAIIPFGLAGLFGLFLLRSFIVGVWFPNPFQKLQYFRRIQSMSASQMRLNTATGEWVIYAPHRCKRPQDRKNKGEQPLDSNDLKNCPFCPGNEAQLDPNIINFFSSKNTPWKTRVVNNKFPVLTVHNHNTYRTAQGIYLTIPAYGKHEVIIETYQHHLTIATMSVEDIEMIIETYHQRYLALMKDPEIMMIMIFRNHGINAGASLQHPHSQIIATSVVPRNRRWQDEEAQRYFDHWKRCLYCDMLTFERQEETRIVEENNSFVAFVPFAAEMSCEVWIMPKRHQADFGSISQSEKKDFAAILQNILSKFYYKLNNPDYNYVINSAVRHKTEEPHIHWYCQILPRLTTPAGFEIGSGMSINPTLPEVDAAFLREK